VKAEDFGIGAKSGEYVTQVTTIGPLGVEYLSPKAIPETATRSRLSTLLPEEIEFLAELKGSR